MFDKIREVTEQEKAKTAIIIGGGMSGKLVAAAISPFFHSVHILEKDEKPSPSLDVRPGVSQGHHIHALLHAGEQALETIFPGFQKDMTDHGAVKIDSLKDLSWFHHGVWKKKLNSEYTTLLQTRPFLESYVEKRVEQLDKVHYLYGVKVLSYLVNADSNCVCGVEINHNKEIHTVTADLVVDSSGSSSFSKMWLEKQGRMVPEEKVEIGLCYATRMFKLPETNRDFKIKLIYPNPPKETLGGTLSLVEGRKYIVTLIGYLNSIKAKDVSSEEAFIDFCGKLPLKDIQQELQKGTSLSDTMFYQIPHIVRRRFDKVEMPEGLLVVGDSFCRIDPVFGQGMSIAALEALAIKRYFRSVSKIGSIKKLQKQLGRIVAPVWSMVLCEDFRYEEVKGKRPFGLRFQQWYVKKIFLLSSKNPKIYCDFVRVMNLTSPATILFKPSTIKEVLKS